jgi:glycosyltransferase involved in cell wall biosynthesis
MPTPPVISAVIPVHNESGFMERVFPDLIASLETVGREFQIIVAENGSSDATAEVARSLGASDDRVLVLQLPDADYGAAMRAGFRAATGEWIVNFDIDYFSGEFVNSALSQNAPVVLASKRADGSDDRRSGYRRLGTWGFNLVLRRLFGSKVTDTHGMKLVHRDVVREIEPSVISNQDLFDTELVLRAERAGYAIAEVPAVVEEMRDARSSFVKRIPRTLAGLWRVRRAMKSERSASE